MEEVVEACIDAKRYQGAEWLRRNLASRGITLSALGVRVADLLGWVFQGVYHVDDAVLSKKAVWDSEVFVRIPLSTGGLSSYDNSTLTRLVVAAHDMAIRVEVGPCNNRYLELMFHPRERNGRLFNGHPTIEAQVARMRAE